MELLTGQVESIAFGGSGIVRHEGMVVFVPFTVPGDVIRYAIIEKKKNFAYGSLVEIVTKSKNRIEPRCPYFGKCGGCQLQHMSYATQVEYKQQSVQSALSRIGHLQSDLKPVIVPAEMQWAYRAHVTLTLRAHHGHYYSGYFETDNKTVFAATVCPIFVEESEAVLKEIQKVAKILIATSMHDAKVSVYKLDGKYLLHFHFKHMPKNAKQIFHEAKEKYCKWSGIIASSSEFSLEIGEGKASFEVEGLRFFFSSHTFLQNHPEQSVNIYRHMCEIAKIVNSKKILDLYCGIGVTSLLLARQGSIVRGIELNPHSIALAKENARANAITHANFIVGDVKKVLEDELAEHCPDFVVTNPPREGMEKEVTQALLKRPPQHLIYVSCMPSTLARDLALLSSEYTLASCKIFDMFPQTAHVETVVHYRKRNST